MKQIAAALAVFIGMAGAVQAQDCVQFEDGAATLANEYGESVIGRGLTPDGVVVVIFANPQTGTWTLVVVRPDGCSQSPADGSDWVTFEPAALGIDG